MSELIEKIKSEGVQTAEQQAATIIGEAEKKASSTLEQARKEADHIVADARQKAARSEQAGKDALNQAARDLILNVQARFKTLFAALIADSVRETYTAATLESAIVSLVNSWKGSELGDLAVQLPKDQMQKLEKGLRDRLAKQIEKGMTIEAAPDLEGGFRLAKKDGGAYYDLSAASIATILAEYLNPRLAEQLNSAMQASQSKD
ncbi:MAG TPA: V-type ATP synthase subunit E [Spirochaetia bacterium]|nr:V-type ATP synthase subunit E [Spirochaetia bacterium]